MPSEAHRRVASFSTVNIALRTLGRSNGVPGFVINSQGVRAVQPCLSRCCFSVRSDSYTAIFNHHVAPHTETPCQVGSGTVVSRHATPPAETTAVARQGECGTPKVTAHPDDVAPAVVRDHRLGDSVAAPSIGEGSNGIEKRSVRESGI